MKTWIKTSALGLIVAIVICLAARAQLNGIIQRTLTPAPDSIVQITAEAMGLEAVALEDLPRGGTYWWVTSSGAAAPLPFPPMDRVVPIYAITDNQFLVDDTGGQVAVRALRWNVTQSRSSSQTVSAVDRLGNAVADLIEQIQQTQFERTMMMSLGLDVPSPGEGGGGGTNGGDYGNYSTYTIDTNLLWLEITNVSNGWSHLNLHSGTNQFYTSQYFAILTKTNLLDTTWNIEAIVQPTEDGTSVMPITVQNFDRPILFFKVQDLTGVDSDSDGIPDWWAWNYFGTPNITDTNLDYTTNSNTYGYGHTFSYDYTNNIWPTVFRYTDIHATNNFVSTSQSAVQLDVAGTPYYIAVSVDDPGFFTNATWNAYSSPNVPVNLGSVEGWHEVWIGLRGHAEYPYQAVWQHHWLKLDTTPPVLVITNPIMAGGAATVDIPMIQIQGYSPEALSQISYDLTNAAGVISNQPVLILNQYYDPASAEYTTNTFQAFDVFLTNGLNAITFHAADLAGNLTTVNYSVTVDYSAKNPPQMRLIWPTNGMSIASDNVTIRGQVDDATVKVVATMADPNNQTNVITGVVERDGRFWLDNMPLMAGTNVISLTATDAAGKAITNQMILQRSSITVTVNAPVLTNGQTTASVTGTVSDPTAVIWVNGVQGTNYGTNFWSADNVPIPPGGEPTFDVTAYPANEAPAPGSGGGGTNPPQTPGAGSGGTATDLPSGVYLYADSQTTGDKKEGTQYDGWDHSYTYDTKSETHHTQWWRPGLGGAGSETSHSESEEQNGGPLVEHDYDMNGSYVLNGSGDGMETGTSGWDGNSSSFSKWVSLGLTWWVGNEHCEVADVKNFSWDMNGYDNQWSGGTSHDDYTRTAQTTYHVQTGGRAIPGRQNLWCFSGSAAMVTDKHAVPPYVVYNTKGLNSQQIQIMGKNLDTNGNVFFVLPDVRDKDVTPQVPGYNFYTFGVGGQKYEIVSWTHHPALADTNRDRLNLGVGEKVDLSGMPANTSWSASAGGIVTNANGIITFTAPSNAVLTVVTASVATVTGDILQITKDFHIFEPSGVDMNRTYITSFFGYNDGYNIFVEMNLRVYFSPLNVSFYQVQIMEVGQDATSIWGCYTNPVYTDTPNNADVPIAHRLRHSNGAFTPVTENNHWLYDDVYHAGIPTPRKTGIPWAEGGYTIPVPAKWTIDGVQTNSMTGWDMVINVDNSGTFKIHKFGKWVQCTTNDNVTTGP